MRKLGGVAHMWLMYMLGGSMLLTMLYLLGVDRLSGYPSDTCVYTTAPTIRANDASHEAIHICMTYGAL